MSMEATDGPDIDVSHTDAEFQDNNIIKLLLCYNDISIYHDIIYINLPRSCETMCEQPEIIWKH